MTRRIRCSASDREYQGSLHVNGTDVIDDLSRLWEGCYISYEDEVWKVVTVKNYDGIPVFYICPALERAGGERDMIVSVDHPVITTQYPPLGYFNVSDPSAAYLTKKVSRQWKRGIHEVNIQLNPLYFEVLNGPFDYSSAEIMGIPPAFRGGLSNCLSYANVYNPTYPKYLAALEALRGGHALSRALSFDFALAVHPVNGEIQVLYHELLCGHVTDTGGIVLREEFTWLSDTIEELHHD